MASSIPDDCRVLNIEKLTGGRLSGKGRGEEPRRLQGRVKVADFWRLREHMPDKIEIAECGYVVEIGFFATSRGLFH